MGDGENRGRQEKGVNRVYLDVFTTNPHYKLFARFPSPKTGKPIEEIFYLSPSIELIKKGIESNILYPTRTEISYTVGGSLLRTPFQTGNLNEFDVALLLKSSWMEDEEMHVYLGLRSWNIKSMTNPEKAESFLKDFMHTDARRRLEEFVLPYLIPFIFEDRIAKEVICWNRTRNIKNLKELD